MKHLVTSIHDVHPQSFDLARDQVSFCESIGVARFSILLVPEFHMGEPFEQCERLLQWLRMREERGDDIVLHGLYHFSGKGKLSPGSWFWNSFYTANEAEFLELDFDAALARMELGRDRMRKAGLHPAGFIAPAWLMNLAVVRAVFNAGFSYTNTVNTVLSKSGTVVHSRSLCYSARSAVRRAVSPGWNSLLWQLKRRDNIVRLSLHPQDLLVPSFRLNISGILRDAIGLGFSSTTYRDLIAAAA
jgi:predicted deacetylase